MDIYGQIVIDLRRLANSNVSVFGSEAHGFLLHPPLPEEELCAFEQTHDVQLPGDYRTFLARVGRGGAGPYYGLFDLHQMDDGFGFTTWKQGDGFVGILANPFPFVAEWNDLTGQPSDELMEADEAEYEKQMDAFEARYWAQLNGAIPICHLGCALRHWLVITGPEAGNVWMDGRAEYTGLHPLVSTGSDRVSFLLWYRDWLDHALARIR